MYYFDFGGLDSLYIFYIHTPRSSNNHFRHHFSSSSSHSSSCIYHMPMKYTLQRAIYVQLIQRKRFTYTFGGHNNSPTNFFFKVWFCSHSDCVYDSHCVFSSERKRDREEENFSLK